MIFVQRPSLGSEELAAVGEVFESRWLGLGSKVKEFENALAEFLGAEHVIAVNTGTSALHIALAAAGVGAGDEVIIPSLTFVATAQAVLAVGATPVFCDVRENDLNIDPADIADKITGRTKVIMPVHYGGKVCDMDSILRLARENDLLVVEDAAHAFGSTYKGRKVGTLSPITCFSFDPIKNITCGEGGAVVTDDTALAEKIIKLRILGISKDTWNRYRDTRSWLYQVTSPGFRYHMPNVNAAIGLVQLAKLGRFIARKREIVRRYDAMFRRTPGIVVLDRNIWETAPFFYVIRVEHDRDGLLQHLKAVGIGAGLHYIPNHLQPLFAKPGVCLPVTEKVWNEIITLPLHYELSEDAVDRVRAEVVTYVRGADDG